MQNSPRISRSAEVLAVLAVAAIAIASIIAIAISPASAYAEGGPAAVAWGDNVNTELGAGYKNTQEERPVSVLGLGNATQIGLGYHLSVARLADGTVETWGGDAFGQLGNGSHVQSGTPTSVGVHGVTQISARGAHVLALLENGTISGWGDNEYGELGNGVLNPVKKLTRTGGVESTMQGSGSQVPLAVPGVKNVVAVASGNGTAFALLSNGTVLAWGRNDKSQLGIGKLGPQICKTEVGQVACEPKPEPVLLPDHEALRGVKAISAGSDATYVILANGKVMSWGNNGHGQLGDGSTAQSDVAVEIKNLSGVVSISGGDPYALALLPNGRVEGWGDVSMGELGVVAGSESCGIMGRCAKTPRLIAGLENVSAVSAGRLFTLALIGGKLYSLGDDQPFGQLGLGGFYALTSLPRPIEGLPPVLTMAAGEQHALAVLASGSGPAPLFSVTPAAGTLVAGWTVAAPAYGLRWRTWSSNPLALGRWSPTVFSRRLCSAGEPCSYEIPPLPAGPVEVELLTYNSAGQFVMGRRTVATP